MHPVLERPRMVLKSPVAHTGEPSPRPSGMFDSSVDPIAERSDVTKGLSHGSGQHSSETRHIMNHPLSVSRSERFLLHHVANGSVAFLSAGGNQPNRRIGPIDYPMYQVPDEG